MPGWFDALVASGAIVGATGPSQAMTPQQPQRFTGMLSGANGFSPEMQTQIRAGDAYQQMGSGGPYEQIGGFGGMLARVLSKAQQAGQSLPAKAQAFLDKAGQQQASKYSRQQDTINRIVTGPTTGGFGGMAQRLLRQQYPANPQQSSPWQAIAQGAGTLGAAMGGGMRKPTTQPTTISVMSPDGETREVPSEQAQHFIQRGARRIG